MHDLTGDRDAVLEVLRQTIFHLGSDKPDVRAKGMKHLGVTVNSNWTTERDTAIDLFQRAYQRERDKTVPNAPIKKPAGQKKSIRTGSFGITAPSESVTKDWYMPRDRTIAVFQAAMDEFIDQKLSQAEKSPVKPTKRGSPGKLSLNAVTTGAKVRWFNKRFIRTFDTAGEFIAIVFRQV